MTEHVLEKADLALIRSMVEQAHVLAASEHVMVRVAGERVAALLADLLYEIDLDAAEVMSLLPPARRGDLPPEGRS